MKTILELFSGTKSISTAFKDAGWDVFTVDNNPELCPDLVADISTLSKHRLPERFQHPDVVWASPPCTCFSVASMGHHWTMPYGTPKTIEAVKSMELVVRTFTLLANLNPRLWFIENPRGMLRKINMMQNARKYRHTVTYCQYGDIRMKPTDIWTNHPNPGFKPMCKNGMTCHQSAPRGSKTGTQGLKNAIERGRIPKLFCEHITKICNETEIR